MVVAHVIFMSAPIQKNLMPGFIRLGLTLGSGLVAYWIGTCQLCDSQAGRQTDGQTDGLLNLFPPCQDLVNEKEEL